MIMMWAWQWQTNIKPNKHNDILIQASRLWKRNFVRMQIEYFVKATRFVTQC